MKRTVINQKFAKFRVSHWKTRKRPQKDQIYFLRLSKVQFSDWEEVRAWIFQDVSWECCNLCFIECFLPKLLVVSTNSVVHPLKKLWKKKEQNVKRNSSPNLLRNLSSINYWNRINENKSYWLSKTS